MDVGLLSVWREAVERNVLWEVGVSILSTSLGLEVVDLMRAPRPFYGCVRSGIFFNERTWQRRLFVLIACCCWDLVVI